MKKLLFRDLLLRSKLHFKIQKDFNSIVSGLAKALRENDDALDDDDDYGSHDSRNAKIGKPSNPSGSLPKEKISFRKILLSIVKKKSE